MVIRAWIGLILGAMLLALEPAHCLAQVIDSKLHHLRSGTTREWDEFPQQPEGKELILRFDSKKNDTEQTLRLRQRDVKQAWNIRFNDKKLATLLIDEKDTVVYFKIAAGSLIDGQNELKISCDGGGGVASDDIVVGDIRILPKSLAESLSESALQIQVSEDEKPLPARITIIDENGSLIALAPPASDKLAVRHGVVYTPDGSVSIKLPAGKYTLYAGRGFEYSLDSAQVTLDPGQSIDKKFSIRRVVATPGYVSCDPHIHTFTYSRHGDCTMEERVITLAGENIELPIAADHNLQIDYRDAAAKLGVNSFFTPVIGNEVTTAAQGHFNIFPIPPESKLINFRAANWDALSTSITEIAFPDPVIILNHARDIHGGFRPDDPKHFLALTGQRLDGRKLFANAMEVVNSGAVMDDPMRLYKDWFGLLNRGYKITPVGASDSHDVSRYIVGQGCTYIRCDDTDPGKISVDEARKNFLAGKVLVSYGLLADITVNQKSHSGDLVPATGNLDVQVTVQSPPWSRANRLALYANGIEIRSVEFPPSPGRTWQTRWSLPKPKHDIHLVAIAAGPGIAENFWPTAKPYQPTSIEFTPYTIGSTGAVFIDADNNNQFDSAYSYAQKLMERSDAPLTTTLANYDEAVAAQVAAILRDGAGEQFEAELQRMMSKAPPAAKRGFEAYLTEWKEHLSVSKPPPKD